MNADELIGQIYSWLEEPGEDFSIEILLDLPEMDWVTVNAMSDRGELINLSYRRRTLSALLSKEINELVCERAAVKAVRRVEARRFSFPGKDDFEQDAPVDMEAG